MKPTTPVFLCVFYICLFSGCARPFQSPDYETLKKTHRNIAILPVDFTYDPHHLPPKIAFEDVLKNEIQQSYLLQEQIYATLLAKSKGDPNYYHIKIQPIQQTNRLLKEQGMGFPDYRTYSFEKIAQLLEVDALYVISVNSSFYVPMGITTAFQLISPIYPVSGDAFYTVDLIHGSEGRKIKSANGYIQRMHFLQGKNYTSKIVIKSARKAFPYK